MPQVVLALTLAFLHTAPWVDAVNVGLNDRAGRNLPALFDFDNYQRLFSKHYGSQLELTTRRVYFMANAFEAYASGVAYKFWKQSYYRALNEFSDWSPKEVDMMENGVATGGADADADEDGVGARPGPDKRVAGRATPDEAAEELEASIVDAFGRIPPAIGGLLHDKEAGPGARPRPARRKRAASVADDALAPPIRPPRSLTIDKLIKTGAPEASGRQRKLVKVQQNPPSNNPHYEPLAMEPMTRGLTDQQEPVEIWILDWGVFNAIGATVADVISGWLGFGNANANATANGAPPTGWGAGRRRKSELPDEVFVDLRQSGCMFEPRKQGRCGSCYAFAGIAMMEYQYCKSTGHLVAFSEQYMLDCGRNRVDRMEGCAGAGGWSVPNFVHNFGLELRSRYPYVGRELDCPYHEGMDLRAAGFIRMDIQYVTRIHKNHWPRLLKHGPLFVTVGTGRSFDQYGGGVYDGRRCPNRTTSHAMLVVGHGREEGQEYWLLRNSHGTRWGEGGYMKLARDAPERCIEFQQGFAWGTKDGRTFIAPKLNEKNPVIDMTQRPQPKLFSFF